MCCSPDPMLDEIAFQLRALDDVDRVLQSLGLAKALEPGGAIPPVVSEANSKRL